MEKISPLFTFLASLVILSSVSIQGAESGRKRWHANHLSISPEGEETDILAPEEVQTFLDCLLVHNTILPSGICVKGEFGHKFKIIVDEARKTGQFPELDRFEEAFESACRYDKVACTNGTCPPCDFTGCDSTTPSQRGKCQLEYEAAKDPSDKATPNCTIYRCDIPPPEKLIDPRNATAGQIHGSNYKSWWSPIFLGLSVFFVTMSAMGASL